MVCQMVIVITAIGGKGREEDGGSKCAIFKRIVRDSLTEKKTCEPDLIGVTKQCRYLRPECSR